MNRNHLSPLSLVIVCLFTVSFVFAQTKGTDDNTPEKELEKKLSTLSSGQTVGDLNKFGNDAVGAALSTTLKGSLTGVEISGSKELLYRGSRLSWESYKGKTVSVTPDGLIIDGKVTIGSGMESVSYANGEVTLGEGKQFGVGQKEMKLQKVGSSIAVSGASFIEFSGVTLRDLAGDEQLLLSTNGPKTEIAALNLGESGDVFVTGALGSPFVGSHLSPGSRLDIQNQLGSYELVGVGDLVVLQGGLQHRIVGQDEVRNGIQVYPAGMEVSLDSRGIYQQLTEDGNQIRFSTQSEGQLTLRQGTLPEFLLPPGGSLLRIDDSGITVEKLRDSEVLLDMGGKQYKVHPEFGIGVFAGPGQSSALVGPMNLRYNDHVIAMSSSEASSSLDYAKIIKAIERSGGAPWKAFDSLGKFSTKERRAISKKIPGWDGGSASFNTQVLDRLRQEAQAGNEQFFRDTFGDYFQRLPGSPDTGSTSARFLGLIAENTQTKASSSVASATAPSGSVRLASLSQSVESTKQNLQPPFKSLGSSSEFSSVGGLVDMEGSALKRAAEKTAILPHGGYLAVDRSAKEVLEIVSSIPPSVFEESTNGQVAVFSKDLTPFMYIAKRINGVPTIVSSAPYSRSQWFGPREETGDKRTPEGGPYMLQSYGGGRLSGRNPFTVVGIDQYGTSVAPGGIASHDARYAVSSRCGTWGCFGVPPSVNEAKMLKAGMILYSTKDPPSLVNAGHRSNLPSSGRKLVSGNSIANHYEILNRFGAATQKNEEAGMQID